MSILTDVRTSSSPELRSQFLTRIFTLLCGSFGMALLAFLTQLLLVRTLNVADYGRLAALLAVVNVIASFSSYGIGLFWLQLFGREGWAAIRWIVPTIKILAIASIAGAGLLAGYVILTSDGPFASVSLVAALLVFVLLGQSLAETTGARLQLEERYLALAGWQSLTQLGRSVVAVFVIAAGFADLPHLLAGYALVGLMIATVSAISLNQVRGGRIALIGHGAGTASPEISVQSSAGEVFIGAAPYCFCTIFYLVYSQAVVAVVEHWIGREAAAMYNAAFLIVAAIYLIPNVVYMKYLVSKIFRWWTQDRQMFSAVFHVGVAANAALGIVCMIAVIGLAPFVIPALFGTRYGPAVPLLVLLSIGIPVRFIQHTYGSTFFSQENMKRKVLYLGGAAVSCVAFSVLLIPRFGVEGAAVSSVLAEVTLLLLYAQGAARHVDGIDIRSTFSIATIRSSLAYIGRSGSAERQPGDNLREIDRMAAMSRHGQPRQRQSGSLSSEAG